MSVGDSVIIRELSADLQIRYKNSQP